MTGQEACSSVRVVPDTCDPAAAQFGTRAKFLLGLWAITTLWSTAVHISPHLRSQLHEQELHCAEEEGTLSCSRAGAKSHLGRGGEETEQEVRLWLVEEAMPAQLGRDHSAVTPTFCSEGTGCNVRHRG